MANEKNKSFNLYDEDDRSSVSISAEESTNMVPNSIIVYVDFTKELPELIKPIRDILENKPKGFMLGIYIVTGYTCNKDIDLFIDYLGSLSSSYLFTYYIRGIIHSEFIQLLFEDSVFVEKGAMLLYKQESLHLLLNNLMDRPDTFRKFIQKFIDVYHDYKGATLIGLNDLESMGFKIQTF